MGSKLRKVKKFLISSLATTYAAFFCAYLKENVSDVMSIRNKVQSTLDRLNGSQTVSTLLPQYTITGKQSIIGELTTPSTALTAQTHSARPVTSGFDTLVSMLTRQKPKVTTRNMRVSTLIDRLTSAQTTHGIVNMETVKVMTDGQSKITSKSAKTNGDGHSISAETSNQSAATSTLRQPMITPTTNTANSFPRTATL